MDFIDKIFSFYDSLLESLPIGWQAVISFAILIFLIWNVYKLIKSGHWIFVALLLILLPGTWPAAKKILFIVWHIIKSLVFRIQSF